MSQTILIVDDERHIRDMVEQYLTTEGFRVVAAANGRDALFVARQERPDLILLDLMMPEMGGYDFMRVYSREADTPIIMLTAKIEENDKVLGLELGADDYITKPFSLRELTARIRAMFRRMAKSEQPDELLRVRELTLDVLGRQVTVAGDVVELTPSEFHILETLMRTPGRVFSRAELFDPSQGDLYDGFERNIDVHIRRLRLKIEPNPKAPVYIETVYGAGYRMAKS